MWLQLNLTPDECTNTSKEMYLFVVWTIFSIKNLYCRSSWRQKIERSSSSTNQFANYQCNRKHTSTHCEQVYTKNAVAISSNSCTISVLTGICWPKGCLPIYFRFHWDSLLMLERLQVLCCWLNFLRGKLVAVVSGNFARRAGERFKTATNYFPSFQSTFISFYGALSCNTQSSQARCSIKAQQRNG